MLGYLAPNGKGLKGNTQLCFFGTSCIYCLAQPQFSLRLGLVSFLVGSRQDRNVHFCVNPMIAYLSVMGNSGIIASS